MDLSHFLARFFGFYLLIAGFLYLFRKEFLLEAVDEYFNSPALLLIASVFTLILGLFLVLAHSVWEWNWRLLITIFCYLTLIKALIILFVPNAVKKSLMMNFLKPPAYYVNIVLMLVLGVYLLYQGYIVQQM